EDGIRDWSVTGVQTCALPICRGLSALLGAESADYASLDRVRLSKMVPIEQLQPGPFQPRRIFDDDELTALADSIKANGILQPIRSEEHTSELQSLTNIVCRLL